jgi:hypothetical protein
MKMKGFKELTAAGVALSDAGIRGRAQQVLECQKEELMSVKHDFTDFCLRRKSLRG